MSDDNNSVTWGPNLLKAVQEVSEQATKQQQEALQQLLSRAGAAPGAAGGADSPDLGDISEQLGKMTQMGTFKTRVQSGGRISIPDAEREALDIEEGDIVQTVVVPVKRNRDDDE
ncbi:AbrB/MazE/SpoVT family DNA-binding domain-containing protein [Natronomonas gomsonensis]|jgi:hypothetical protein|uniref:AbrB/MazE/SpoVT family DNA-binding domain-containing protein n=1 Tax=Natronomonas gomsonensis TaxID=1046043 RepID=UPI0020CA3F1B|nr:AbrB/MazE/SpoVT family DNA-binding domain-containing protein [Natronomonas gomsonensis]MCY4729538.1 AbrB/MazE/SpoVT family DNA-binding domain-containing protein [Natronomonas gomsonensis]